MFLHRLFVYLFSLMFKLNTEKHARITQSPRLESSLNCNVWNLIDIFRLSSIQLSFSATFDRFNVEFVYSIHSNFVCYFNMTKWQVSSISISPISALNITAQVPSLSLNLCHNNNFPSPRLSIFDLRLLFKMSSHLGVYILVCVSIIIIK